MFKFIRSTFLVLAAFLLITANVEAISLDEIVKSGVLKMGVNPGLPPLAKYN